MDGMLELNIRDFTLDDVWSFMSPKSQAELRATEIVVAERFDGPASLAASNIMESVHHLRVHCFTIHSILATILNLKLTASLLTFVSQHLTSVHPSPVR